MNYSAILQKRISERFGLVPGRNWEKLLSKAITDICSAYSCTENEIERLVDQKPEVLAEFAAYFTVGETHFLRHMGHFTFIAKTVKQKLQTLKKGETVRIWSAGCATGEEPYSVAVILLEELSPPELNRVEIIASDINRASIEKAQKRYYRSWSFRGTPPWFLARYFEPAGENGVQIDQSATDQVKFITLPVGEHLNQMSNDSVDIILFRNVAIYFDRPSLDRAYAGFFRVLKDNGYLIVAPADPRPDGNNFVNVSHESTSIYRASKSAKESATSPIATVTPITERFAALTRTAVPDWFPPRKKAIEHEQVSKPLPFKNGSPKTSSGTSPNQAAPASPVNKHRGHRNVVEHGNSGDLARALELANCLVQSQPSSKEALLLRGQIRMAREDHAEAVTDLRRAVYLDGDDIFARFWFAGALCGAGHLRRALGEWRTLENVLKALPPQEILEDGETTAEMLLDLITIFKEGIDK